MALPASYRFVVNDIDASGYIEGLISSLPAMQGLIAFSWLISVINLSWVNKTKIRRKVKEVIVGYPGTSFTMGRIRHQLTC